MSQTVHDMRDDRRSSLGRRETIVYGAMTIVAVAAGVAGFLHGGLPGPIAAVVGLAVLVAMVSAHLLVGGATGRQGAGKSNPKAGRSPRSAARHEPNLERSPSPGSISEPVARSGPQLSPPPLFDTEVVAPTAAEYANVGPAAATNAENLSFSDLPASPEMIADIIKGLSLQAADRMHDGYAEQASAAAHHQPEELHQPSAAIGDFAVTMADEQIITRSVAALRETAGAMEHPEARQNATRSVRAILHGHPVAAEESVHNQPHIAANAFAEIAEAIQSDRLATSVDPILGLRAGEAMHQEIAVRLQMRSGDGRIPDDVESIARGTSLMSLLEALVVARAVNAGRALASDGKASRDKASQDRGGVVFARVTAGALDSERVVDALTLGTVENGVADPVVLMFSAASVKAFSQTQWATLADLSDLGFRFAVDQIVDLDLDLGLLCNVGFAFAKFDASTFLQGVPAAHSAFVPPAEICRLLRQMGLRLIVSGIDDAAALSRISALGVDFGMGSIFQAELRSAKSAAA